tara:strand:+ start:173 stop:1255 length:1083 start_codon:yes stop_codon:yes gene_type:complete
MKVKEIMERAGINQTGRAIAYIKDGLEEIELFTKQNVVRGSLASLTSTGIAMTGGQVFSTNDQQWVGANDSTFGAGVPTNWSLYENDAGHTDPHFAHVTTNEAGDTGNFLRIKNKFDTAVDDYVGITRNFTVDANSLYNFQAILTYGTHVDSADRVYIKILDTSTGTTLMSEYAKSGGSSRNDINSNFATLDGTTITIRIYFDDNDAGLAETPSTNLYFEVGNISLSKDVNTLTDSNSGLSIFNVGDKLLINGSKNNDTDKSANTSLGYYTIATVSAGTITIDTSVDTFGGTETAGNSITLRSQTPNYMDIIKDKRFYPLPDDMLKLMDVKIKNHKNGNDKYKSVERAIYAPSEQDGDNI